MGRIAMNIFASVVLALLLGSPAAKTVNLQNIHNATHHTAQTTVSGTALCSATAVGPHALLTASHCEEPTDKLSIQGEKDDADITIVDRIRDGQDHTIYLLSGVTFKDFVVVDTQHKLQQGEDVFFFGNPGAFYDLFRKGYYSGIVQNDNPFSNAPAHLMFDLNDWHGDSGSGIFDSNGDIVAVLSGMSTQTSEDGSRIQFSFAYDLAFKQVDLNKARLF